MNICYNDYKVKKMIYNDKYILKSRYSLLAPIYEPPLTTHNHTFFEFSFIRRGHCTNVINNIRYPISRGICALLRPSDCHFFDNVMPTNPKKYEHIDVYVFQDCFMNCCNLIDSRLYDDILKSEKPIVFNLSNELLDSLDNKIDYLINNQQSELSKSFHKIIIFSLLGAYLEEKEFINHNYPQWLNDLLAYLNTIDAISSNVTILAEKYGYSPEHLSREFKKYTGEKLIDYITRQRIKYSLTLITENSMRIIDIAQVLGYQKQSSFSANFKSIMNCTPKQFQLLQNKQKTSQSNEQKNQGDISQS